MARPNDLFGQRAVFEHGWASGRWRGWFSVIGVSEWFPLGWVGLCRGFVSNHGGTEIHGDARSSFALIGPGFTGPCGGAIGCLLEVCFPMI